MHGWISRPWIRYTEVDRLTIDTLTENRFHPCHCRHRRSFCY